MRANGFIELQLWNGKFVKVAIDMIAFFRDIESPENGVMYGSLCLIDKTTLSTKETSKEIAELINGGNVVPGFIELKDYRLISISDITSIVRTGDGGATIWHRIESEMNPGRKSVIPVQVEGISYEEVKEMIKRASI